MSWTTESRESPRGDITVLGLAGELDLHALPDLDAALDAQLDAYPRHLLVDLAAVTFCSVRAMSRLAHARDTATQRGTNYVLAGAPGWLDRHLRLVCRGDELPTLYSSTAAAVTALHRQDR